MTSLAILPFRNASGDPSLDWLASSLSETLTTDVGQSASLRTVSSDRLHQVIKDLHINLDAQLDPQNLKQLGEFSNAQTLVWGQYVKVGEQIRIDATLQDLKQQRSFTLKAEAPSVNQLLAAVDRLAQSIRENLAMPPDAVKELQAQAFRPSSQSVDALHSYSDGLELVRQGNISKRRKNLRLPRRLIQNLRLPILGWHKLTPVSAMTMKPSASHAALWSLARHFLRQKNI